MLTKNGDGARLGDRARSYVLRASPPSHSLVLICLGRFTNLTLMSILLPLLLLHHHHHHYRHYRYHHQGGRSVRPILERIDFAVDAASDPTIKEMPWPSYSPLDLLMDFKDTPGGVLAAGGTSDPEAFPPVEARGGFWADADKTRRPFGKPPGRNQTQHRVAIAAHSAAGWISRIFVSSGTYACKRYAGQDKVCALVALGTPFTAGATVETSCRISLFLGEPSRSNGCEGAQSRLAICSLEGVVALSALSLPPCSQRAARTTRACS